MTGSLQIKKSNNTYYAVLNMKDETGKRKQKWISTEIRATGGNKRKAEKALRDILKQYEENNIRVTNNKKFTVYMQDWLDYMKNHVEKETWQNYKYAIDKHIIPYFLKVNVTLQNIEPIHIQNFYSHKMNEGLSANTVKHFHANIRKALQDAMLLNIISYNPADRVKLPKVHKYSANFYNVKQANTLLKVIQGESIETPVFLCMYYGLRRGEVLGLKWKAIDFENKTISINTTITYIREKNRTKNVSSNRMLPLIPNVEAYLQKLLKKQDENEILFGKEYIQNDFVCKWDDGTPFKPDYVSNRFRRLLEKNNLPRIRFHDLRHSCASILSASGCDLKKISEWLGHSDISTTANLYTHLEYQSKVEIGNNIQNLLN